jgi:hypothetical protein
VAFADNRTKPLFRVTWGAVSIVLAADAVAGDLLGYSSGWKPALATQGGVIQPKLIAAQTAVSGRTIRALVGGVCHGRISGATPGAPLYTAEGTSVGCVTETKPTTQNDANKPVGFAIDATTCYLHPAANPETVAA